MGKGRLEAFSDGVIAIIITMMVLYFFGIASTFLNQWVAQTIYVAVALMWLIPDRRLEKALSGRAQVGKI